jgi:ABC-type multidrug transport system fused ATPase/permease subunit
VRLDGHDLRHLRLADLRRHVVLVEQEPVLLHASIAENLRYRLVDDGRAPVSPGERQRLALARAFPANPSVLVLDEPTAALDPISEGAVVEGYRAVMRGRTTLIAPTI